MLSTFISIIYWDLKNNIQVRLLPLWTHCKLDLASTPCITWVPTLAGSLCIDVNLNASSNYSFVPVLKMSRYFLSPSLHSSLKWMVIGLGEKTGRIIQYDTVMVLQSSSLGDPVTFSVYGCQIWKWTQIHKLSKWQRLFTGATVFGLLLTNAHCLLYTITSNTLVGFCLHCLWMPYSVNHHHNSLWTRPLGYHSDLSVIRKTMTPGSMQ